MTQNQADVAPISQTAESEQNVWEAQLKLGFARAFDASRLLQRSHHGPLRVQKALYPEGPDICHAIIIHPPGGIVGGDRLQIQVSCAAGCHALLTTPGAAKWYKSMGQVSHQAVHLELAAGSVLEWLPQETIVFDAAQVDMLQEVRLQGDAQYLGSEILCFGRQASGERFTQGSLSQRTRIWRDQQLLWSEQGQLQAGSAAMHSLLGLRGHTVSATLLAAGRLPDAAQMQALREAMQQLCDDQEPGAAVGASVSKNVLVARYLGDSSEVARAWVQLVWQHLRPIMCGKAAQIPRIWQT